MTPGAAKRVVAGMQAAGIDFVTFLPESRMSEIVPAMEAADITLVRTGHEGSAVALATGAALVGRRPAIYMEGAGLFLSAYSLVAVALRVGVPLLLIVTWSGSPSDSFNDSTFSIWGVRVARLLDALGIPWEVIDEGDSAPEGLVERRVADMARTARSAKSPACLLFNGEFIYRR